MDAANDGLQVGILHTQHCHKGKSQPVPKTTRLPRRFYLAFMNILL